jgi:sulfur carrier protein ThiS adenylyltransferase
MTASEITVQALTARQPTAYTARFQKAVVGIAGVGGLGTVVAEQLARAGVGELILVDGDSVELSNLNRQRFNLSQLHLPKAEQMALNIRQFTPCVKVTPHQLWLTERNCIELFGKCDLVLECLDRPDAKAEIVIALRKKLPNIPCITASGVAGLGDPAALKVRRVSQFFYVVGDMTSEAEDNRGLFASKVGAVASLQAWLALRILSGEP